MLPRETRHQFGPKLCEATAELMVSVGVEKTHDCSSQDVEAALGAHEGELQSQEEFAQASHMLASRIAIAGRVRAGEPHAGE